jgi:hypothetical protein
MLYDNPRTTTRIILAAVVLAFGMLQDVALSAQAPAPTTAPHATAPATKPGAAPATSHYVPNALPKQAQMYYQAVWGIDSLKIKYTESGEIIRFSYRVLDPAKAAPINDKASEPFLYDPQAKVKLVVPTMEKIGQLRQSSTPIAGKSYWMAFSNSGRRVRPGDRVSVEVGQFRAINLMVE